MQHLKKVNTVHQNSVFKTTGTFVFQKTSLYIRCVNVHFSLDFALINILRLRGLYGGTQSLNMFQTKFGYNSSIFLGLNFPPNMIFHSPMQLPTTLEFWSVLKHWHTRKKFIFLLILLWWNSLRTMWFLRKYTTSLYVPDQNVRVTVLVCFESMNMWCHYGRKSQAIQLHT